MKKIIVTISVISMLAMVGCAPGGNDITRDNTLTRNNGATNYGANGVYPETTGNGSTYDGYQYTRNNALNGVDGDNNWNTLDGNMNGNNNVTRNASLGDANKISSIENVCNRKKNVEDTSVVINNDTAYVGLDLENNAKLTETMKEELSNQIKRTDPSITKVYFTEDRNAIDDFADSVKGTVDVDWNRLQNIFR